MKKTLFFLFLLLLVPLTSASQVSYWNLDTLTDEWGSNDLTNNGTTQGLTFPIFNFSGNSSPDSSSFSGTNQNLFTAHNSSLDLTGNFTISSWINTSSSTAVMGVYRKMDATGGYLLAINSGEIFFRIKVSGISKTLSSTGLNLDDGDYHNIVTGYNGTHLYAYSDGVYYGSLAQSSPASSSSLSFTLGGEGSALNWFQGEIDEVMIFSHTLNYTEIVNIYNNGTPNGTSTPTPLGADNIIINSPTNKTYVTYGATALVNITTGHNSNCSYGLNSTYNFTTQGTAFTSTGLLDHTFTVAANALNNYSYYYKCRNASGNITTSTNHVFKAKNADWDNELLVIGDSVARAIGTGILDADTYHYKLAAYLLAIDEWYSLTRVNSGVGGSCLSNTQTCSSGTVAMEDRIISDLIAHNSRINYVMPNINDDYYNVTISNYRAALDNIFSDFDTHNINGTIIFSTITGNLDISGYSWHYTSSRIAEMNAEIREKLVLEQYPLFEWHFLHNHNASIMKDDVHLNISGNNLLNNTLYPVVKNPSNFIMSADNWSLFHDCNNSISLLNYTFKMEGGNCSGTSSDNWLVIGNITNESFSITRADLSFYMVWENTLLPSQRYVFTTSDGGSSSHTTNTTGGLNVTFSADTLLNVTYLAKNVTTSLQGIAYYNFSSMADLWNDNDAITSGTSSLAIYPTFNTSGNSSPNSSYFHGLGNDTILLPFTLDGNWSFSLWVYKNISEVEGILTTAQYSLPTRDGLILASQIGNLVPLVYNNGVLISSFGSFAVQPLNQWFHVGMTYNEDNRNMSLYFNGTYISSSTLTDDFNNDNNILLGRLHYNSPYNDWQGAMDEAKFYNTVLSPQNINNLFNIGSPATYNINFTVYEVISNNSISANITILGSTKTTSENFSLTPNNYTANITSTGYYYQMYDLEVLTNETFNVTGLYTTKLNITVRDALTNNSLNSNITLSSDNYTWTSSLTNLSTTIFNITQGDYTLTIAATNAATYTDNLTISSNGLITQYHYLQPRNAINITFYDELNLSLINYRNITLELISDTYSYNYSTSNGTLFLTLLSPEDYYLRYFADNYSTGNYYFSLADNTYNNLRLYMIPDGSSTNLTVNVYDSLSNAITGANVKLLKYFVDNNSFVLVSAGATNFEGSVLFPVEKYTEYYKFIIEYDGESVLTTSPTYITGDEIDLYINLLTSGFDTLFANTGLYGVIDYLNTTNILKYTYNDKDNTATGGCFYAYRITYSGETLVNSSCGTGAANTLYMSVSNVTGTHYKIKGYITKGGENIYVTDYLLSFQEYASSDTDGLILAVILLLTMVFIGFWRLEIAVIMAGVSVLSVSVLKLIILPLTMAIPIFVLSFVVAAIISRRREA